jgi:hypothetical protein
LVFADLRFDLALFCLYNLGMTTQTKKRRGAPKKPALLAKGAHVQLRINPAEKEAFQKAAELDGKKLSEWMRDRLRKISKQELGAAGLDVPFVTRTVMDLMSE